MARIILKPNRDTAPRKYHPWIFQGAVHSTSPGIQDGDIVDVCDFSGQFIGRGYYNHSSQIVVRLLTWAPHEEIDTDFWARRLQAAFQRRERLLDLTTTNAYRLVFAEADSLPGLIVDRYADCLVVQFLTLGLDRRKKILVDLLEDLLHPRTIFERSTAESRHQHEGLAPVSGPLRGDPPPPLVEIQEKGHRFLVDILAGHKTGFYLDQRENRARVAPFCTGREVLNAFCYTGGFGPYAHAHEAAHVVHVDSSAEALRLARRNLALNGYGSHDEFCNANVFETLREFRTAGRTFDLIILDPPKFAATKKQLDRAYRGYKDLNLQALHLLRPGGLLATFSCSGAMDPSLFRKVLEDASVDARRPLHLLDSLGQPLDHPVLLSFPEGQYLKGFICQALD